MHLYVDFRKYKVRPHVPPSLTLNTKLGRTQKVKSANSSVFKVCKSRAPTGRRKTYTAASHVAYIYLCARFCGSFKMPK